MMKTTNMANLGEYANMGPNMGVGFNFLTYLFSPLKWANSNNKSVLDFSIYIHRDSFPVGTERGADSPLPRRFRAEHFAGCDKGERRVG
jgi:hypothetical protein